MKKKCWMLTMVAVLTLSVAAMFTGCSNKNDAANNRKNHRRRFIHYSNEQ